MTEAMRGLWRWVAAVLVMLSMAACTDAPDIGNRRVVFQLNWTPDPTFTGVYVAIDRSKNFFAHEGLAVEVQVGGFGIDPLASVIAKKAQMAVVGADKAAIAFANGAPIRVVAVDFQRNPVGWIVRRSRGVNKLRDLAARKDLILGDKFGTETSPILKIMLKRLQLDGTIPVQPVGFEFAYFLQNERVVYPVYLNEEPLTAAANGVEVIEIDPSAPENGGVKLYGNVIVAHRDTVAQDPKLVLAFVRALRRGWDYAKSNPHETEALLRRVRGFDTPQMPGVLARSVLFATSADGIDVAPGHMEIAHWERTLAVLKEGGLLLKDIELKEFVWFEGGA